MTDRALLALEDGTVFEGVGLGARGTTTGEVCFNTGLSGYQEVLTDPSYHGQIVTMTAPQIGNTGVNGHDDQSLRPWVAGFVVREESPVDSSWRSEGSLDDYLRHHSICGIAEVDTRRLTRHLRDRGAMRGALSNEIDDGDELIDVARAARSMIGADLAREVTTLSPFTWGAEDLERRARTGFAAGAEWSQASAELLTAPDSASRFKVAAFDFGIKRNILDLLASSGCDVTVVPATTSPKEVEAGFDGVFLSNGPGDPEPVTYGVETTRRLLGRVPVFGICLGHQILALALGAKTFKLPFGHRGGNHPVKRSNSPRVEITCQNHGFAVDPASIETTPARLTHRNLNDSTVEGLEMTGVCFSVQYHPESGPGPHDSRYLFDRFRKLMNEFEPAEVPVAVH
jgi:carbamoyl-phosphate synthase small subunit